MLGTRRLNSSLQSNRFLNVAGDVNQVLSVARVCLGDWRWSINFVPSLSVSKTRLCFVDTTISYLSQTKSRKPGKINLLPISFCVTVNLFKAIQKSLSEEGRESVGGDEPSGCTTPEMTSVKDYRMNST